MKPIRPFVLGIETSCDDTACAVVDGAGRVLASVVSSQLQAHRPYGGVVPEIASREHLLHWPAVCSEALSTAGLSLRGVDVVAATRGPGLVGSLLVGLSLGRAIAFALEKPFHAVHHLEGHLFSPFLNSEAARADAPPARFIGLVISGGHTVLVEVQGNEISTLGQTRDDAMGEAFDKIGKRLGLPFPGGPWVDELAELGSSKGRPLPIPNCGDNLDFSYSGLKTRTLVEIERLEKGGVPTRVEPGATPPQEVVDLLAGFRAAAVGQVVERLNRFVGRGEIRTADGDLPLLAVSGGVAANSLLRRALSSWSQERDAPLKLVRLGYAGDNAAMIAHAALLRHRKGLEDDPLETDVASRIPFPLSLSERRTGQSRSPRGGSENYKQETG